MRSFYAKKISGVELQCRVMLAWPASINCNRRMNTSEGGGQVINQKSVIENVLLFIHHHLKRACVCLLWGTTMSLNINPSFAVQNIKTDGFLFENVRNRHYFNKATKSSAN